MSSINDFPTTPESSEPELPVEPVSRRRKKTVIDVRAAVPVALPEKGRIIAERPIKTVVKSLKYAEGVLLVPSSC